MAHQPAELRVLRDSGNFVRARSRGIRPEGPPSKGALRSADRPAVGDVSRTVDKKGNREIELGSIARGVCRDFGAHVSAFGSEQDLAGVRAKTSKPLTIFYGYPPELIARWCGVSAHTAYLYKIGARKPSRQALRLFTLHRDGRVLGPEWRNWAIHKDRIVSPEGQETTQTQLAAYWLIMQLARELASRDPEARDRFTRLLRSA